MYLEYNIFWPFDFAPPANTIPHSSLNNRPITVILELLIK